jgi:hypothetical protein
MGVNKKISNFRMSHTYFSNVETYEKIVFVNPWDLKNIPSIKWKNGFLQAWLI